MVTKSKRIRKKKIMSYDMTVNGSLPGGMAQVVGLNDEKTVQTVKNEIRAEETINETIKLFEKMTKDPKHVEPVIFGTDVKGNLRIIPLKKNKYGSFKMPEMSEWKAPSIWDVRRKKRKVKKIMKYLNPILKRDIGEISELALARKDEKTLDKLYDKLQEKETRKRISIRDRLSCFYVETDDDSVLLSG